MPLNKLNVTFRKITDKCNAFKTIEPGFCSYHELSWYWSSSNPGRASRVEGEFEGYNRQGGHVVRKCIWGESCETGGKIKIPLWPAVNLRLLTAQRSCCVIGFLMALQQLLPWIALTWFISPFTPPHHNHHLHTAVPPSSSNIQFLSLSPPVFIDTHCILCAQGYNLLFSNMPVAGNICL